MMSVFMIPQEQKRKEAEASLAEVKRLAAQIGDNDTRLITDAKRAYARFVQDVNKLAIDETARY